MNKKLLSLGVVSFLLTAPQAFAQTEKKQTLKPVSYYSDPSISPDGNEIAFTSGGDIWTVATTGGTAHLLVADQAYDSRPIYSPDGKLLAFNSTRTGNGDIYIFNLKTNELKRLTYDDGNESLSAWSADGKYVYFSTTSHDISSMNDVYRIKSTGGTPMPVSYNRYMNEFFAMPSPNGKTLAFAARGIASSQWWRNGSSHLDQSEIWLSKDGSTPGYEKVTAGGAKELWPMWSSDGATLYYVSDRGGVQNLWSKTLTGSPKQLTSFTKGRIIWPTMAYSGKSIVFEHDFKVWKYDTATSKASEVNITCQGAAANPGIAHQKLTTGFRGLVLSPDAKKAAFIVHGDVFVAAAKTGGDAYRVTQGTGVSQQIIWAANSNSLMFIASRDDSRHLYKYDFITRKETQLTNTTEDDGCVTLSPDGKLVAFIRNGKKLMTLNLDTHEEKLITTGYITRPAATDPDVISWSPDGKWLAYGAYGVKNFYNVYVAPVAGGEPKQVSFLANSFGGDITWSPNGKYILMSTNQRTEQAKIARIDLVPQLPKFREDQFQQMFTETTTSPDSPLNPAVSKPAASKQTNPVDSAAVAEKKPARGVDEVKIVMDGIRQRLNMLPFDGVNYFKISKDGKTLLVSAGSGRQANLYTYSLDELATEPATLKPVSTSGEGNNKNDAQFSNDGREIYYLEQGKIASINLDSRVTKPIAVTAEMDVDFNKEKLIVFEEAWKIQNKGFYDEHFHGTNWNDIRATYEPLVAGASTPEELRRLLNLMVGELNSSHSGVSGPSSSSVVVGRLGLGFDRVTYETTGKFKITEVIPLGAADLTGNIHVGDYLKAIDEQPLTDSSNLDELLQNKINRRVTLVVTAADGTKSRQVNVRPLNQATEKGLLYRAWVQQQREYVNKISGGRLGYVHIFDMSEQALTQLYMDLDVENQGKEGVVVDIRNNNGGFVNAYALDVLTRKPYLTMTGRGLTPAPARPALGQRALEVPTILVTNQHSLSDAEDFTEGYRTMKLGKVVGEPTGGWIIFTGSATLIDGSSLRTPFSKITDHEGKDMELHPRPVDIAVSRQLGEGNDRDSQLDAAVKELLKDLNDKK